MANDWYVTTTGAGLHNGSITDPWTLAEAVAEYESAVNVLVGDSIWVKANATYTTAGITLTRDGSSLGYIRWAGYTDNIGDLGKATIQRSGGAGVLVSSAGAYYNIFENFIFDGQNSGTDNFASGRYSNTINCESYDAGSDGFIPTYLGGTMVNCVAHDNGNSGFNGGGGLFNCLSYDNDDSGFFGIYSCWVDCIAYSNDAYGFFGNRICGHFNCTSYGNTLGEVNFQYGGISVNNSINPLVNKYAFFEATDFVNYEIYNNIDGASAGFDTNGTQFSRNVTTLQANYNAPASLDFTRTSTNLDGIGLSEIGMVSVIDYNISIGVYNPVSVIPDYPDISDVRLGVDYDSTTKTGSLDLPSINDVEKGVQFDSTTKTGTFKVPDIGDVRLNIDYGANDIEFTGTLDLPSTEDVEFGVQFDNNTKTGSFVVPSESDVEDGVTYGDSSEFTGNVTLPIESNVETGIQYGASGIEFTGSLDLPGIADVRLGTDYDGATKTGTCAVPVASNVRLAIDVDDTIGTLDLPVIGDVEFGVIFDNTTKTGTFVVPSEIDVRTGKDYGDSSEFTGSLDLPLIIDVRLGTDFDNTTKTGTLDLPSIQDVEYGVKFDRLTKTGLFVSPAVSKVETGTLYGYNGEFIGTLAGDTTILAPLELTIDSAELEVTIEDTEINIEVE